VDELRAGLELATDDELALLTNILFCRRFNPLDYLYTPDPIDIQSQSHQQWIGSLEERFRFLAADGLTVLRRQSQVVTYRQVLIQLCRFLKLPYQEEWSTTDLEAEIFLYLLNQTWKRLPLEQQLALTRDLEQSLSTAPLAADLPAAFRRDPLRLMLKGSSALAVTSMLRPWLLKQVAQQFARHAATYYAAKQTLTRGGTAIAAQVQNRVALQMASRGMAVNAARYGAVRSVLAFVGPALWTWFLLDLGWRAIATNYSRIIPVVFTVAQIRLTRTDWEIA
jgi:uncharacterized protein YaaW (UPF0174 family)